MSHTISIDLYGKKMEITSGKMAKQADGSVCVRLEDTVVMANAVSARSLRDTINFFPLTVDYRERTSAIGRFPGGYLKREGRPTEKEILTCRLTDRPMRPLFPEDYYYEVQIINSVLSADEDNDPDILSIIGASAALHISDIPFHGPVGAVRIGLINDEFIINPTYEEIKKSRMNIIIAATEKGLVMVEGSADLVSEDCLFDALMTGFKAIQPIIQMQKDLRDKLGKEKRTYTPAKQVDAAVYEKVKEGLQSKMADALKKVTKKDRSEALKSLFEELLEKLKEADEDTDKAQVSLCFEKIEKDTARAIILNENIRCDGRGYKDIRPIECEIELLPRTHGSALFTRGETQALVMTTLGGAGDTQGMETYEGKSEKTFMLHYNFPPFSVGETRPQRGPGRREIGHGILAERALSAVLPDAERFPYTIKIISDVLESNGSSSMASVCGGSLSLMDAGVPVKGSVSGIAMGLVIEGDKKAILSDIQGMEDHLGDMDFKVAGTRDGISAIQMDLKVESIDESTLKEALTQSKEGRMHILDVMEKTLKEPKGKLSKYAPKIATLTIPKEKIGLVIGPGGANIKRLIEAYTVQININDDGIVSVYSSVQEDIDGAIEEVRLMTSEVEPGKIYNATVKKIVDFGAFVEFLPSKEGLLHISRIADHRVARVEDELKVGEKIFVKCLEIDERGRPVLSKKHADSEMSEKSETSEKA